MEIQIIKKYTHEGVAWQKGKIVDVHSSYGRRLIDKGYAKAVAGKSADQLFREAFKSEAND